MDPWFFRDPARLDLEREAIRGLEERADWLEGTEWVLDGSLAVDAAIRSHGHVYRVRLTFSAIFPFSPPAVRPLVEDEHWSSHQYLDGTLCLEWGPDTWRPEVTGAQVLESAHRLLEIENPLGEGDRGVVPSRHHLTLGQTVRGRYGRVYAEPDFFDSLATLPTGTSGGLDFTFLWQRESYTVLVQAVRPRGSRPWEGTAIPSGVRGTGENCRLSRGVFVASGSDGVEFQGVTNVAGIGSALRAGGWVGPDLECHDWWRSFGLEELPAVLMILDCDHNVHFYMLLNDQDGLVRRLTLVKSPPQSGTMRNPGDFGGLSGKKVGIVGLGSLGAKVALSLGRMGVRDFLLVDDDVFLPENICRHPLDWRSVGQHKVDAVAEALERITPGLNIQVSQINLTGQENAASLNGLLNRLGRCDLLMEMTASQNVFNLLSAVSTINSKPLVWAEVFAGGIGGLVGRSRPRKDPSPQTVRAAYHGFTAEFPFPDLEPSTAYAVVEDDGRVLSASDAEVGVVASHASGLAADTLLDRVDSAYPNSLYLVGLARAWVFDAPFHTIPISTDHLGSGGEAPDGASPIPKRTAEFLR